MVLYGCWQGGVFAAQKEVATIDTANFMAAPVTELSELEKNPNDMKTKMELLILRIQVRKKFWF